MQHCRILGLALLCLLAGPAAYAQSPEILPPDLPPLQEDPTPSTELGPPLDAPSFDALTQGRTFDTYDAISGFYGIESFLPNRRVVWQDAGGCTNGSWAQSGDQICFNYDNTDDSYQVCWTYHQDETRITGLYQGHKDLVPIYLYATERPTISCDNYLGS